MLATLVIVFREVIEAGLIVGIVLAASKGAAGRGLWVSLGILGGLLGACLVALFAGRLASMFQGSGQELFNAGILFAAVIMLAWHNVWMAGHGQSIALEMRKVGGAVAAGRQPMSALAVVVGVAVLREGSEVVLFLYGIASAGGESSAAMLLGGVLGIAGGALLSALMYLGLVSIPIRRLFAVTTGLITLLAAGMASQAIGFLQQAGYLQDLSDPLWDTSAILPQDSLFGRVLHGLVGYSDSPTGAQLAAYAATILVIVGLMRLMPARRTPAAGSLAKT
ncbi:MAG TPA: FTR1 family protein [Dongiaceae bacterium]|nr:FTR1 family protein [Dongiaceae bacterium]